MTTITQHLTMRVLVPGSAALPVKADLTYDPAAPFEVACAFTEPTGEIVPWSLSRDLLDAGMKGQVGIGDVMIWPSNEHGPLVAYLQLSTPEGTCVIEAPVCGLRPFLDKTYVVVPYGTEGTHYDLDAELLALTA